MKKVISAFLCALIVLCALPVGAFAEAEPIHFSESASFATNIDLESGLSYIVDPGVIMTVPSDVTLYIPSGCALTVERGATLAVNGKVNILAGGKLLIEGTVINSDNVSGVGEATVEVRYPDYAAVASALGGNTHPVTIRFGSENTLGKIEYKDEIPYGQEEIKPLNSVEYLKVEIIEPDAKYNKYDEKYIDVYYGGATMKGEAGIHEIRFSTAGDFTFTKFDGSKTFYTDCLVTLPAGEGYDSESLDGHTSSDAPYTVKFGTPVSFKVNVDEDYNQVPYQVYIYNGAGFVNGTVEVEGQQVTDDNGLLLYISGVDAAKPDEYGYYNFTAKGETKLMVLGVLPNEKIEQVGDILSVIRNIFEVIRNIIKEFFAMLGIEI